ncbi:putative ester cyclase [Deinococcus sp. UYEF24]
MRQMFVSLALASLLASYGFVSLTTGTSVQIRALRAAIDALVAATRIATRLTFDQACAYT